MQSFPAPAWRLARPAPRRRLLGVAVAGALALVLVLVLVLARGSDGGGKTAPVRHAAMGAGPALIGGHALQQADCTDWLGGSAKQRSEIIAAVTGAAGGAAPGYGNGATLPAVRARSMFDTTCGGPAAQHWLLYELYNRAAGFRGGGFR